MSTLKTAFFFRTILGLFVLVGASVTCPLVRAGEVPNPARGLWVGQVVLNYVNEVAVPLDENNVAIAPDSQVTTPTADQAHLRLLVHVDGAGQVALLKDVAILNRSAPAVEPGGVVNLNTNRSLAAAGLTMLTVNSDASLVTDDRIYGEFPPQPALRIASAAFDFGDSRTTDAVDAIVEEAVQAAAATVNTNTADLSDATNRKAAEDAAAVAGEQAAQGVLDHADVAEAFFQFLTTNLTGTVINSIADDPAVAQPYRLQAETLRDRSFYGDSRAVHLIDKVVSVVTNANLTTPEERRAAAQAWASAYADITDEYGRFIASKDFGDMIATAAAAAARAATNAEATLELIRNQVEADPDVRDARVEALRVQVTLYADIRAGTAVSNVVDAVVWTAWNSLTNGVVGYDAIRSAADEGGRQTLADEVPRYGVVPHVPTTDYTEFVRGEVFAGALVTASRAAAEGAVAEKRANALFSLTSLQREAEAAAVNALRDVYREAARALRTELPLQGRLGAGAGDSRLTWDITQNGEAPLGDAALTGTIVLPASHPTNPFRHRRHPDHTVGFDITRHLRLDFDPAPTGAVSRAGYGVDRLTGTYREEITGLHKPLGPQQNIGLKVEGKFELNRISLIDILNAR